GKFLISNIPPGTYRLMATSVGFCTVLVLDVEILADSTTNVLIRMTKSVIETGAVSTVTGEKKDLDFNQTGTVNIPMIPPQSTAPVATVDELVGRECGKTKDANGELHLRGSRAEKAQYLVGGVNYSEPLCGQPFPPAHGGSAIVNGQAYDAMFFKNYGVNPFVDTEDDHFSTFAVDVDDASYIMTRSYLERGNLPPDEAVRVEEFVNHFNYGYDPPRHDPFTTYFDGSPSKFGKNSHMLRIGIKGLEIDPKFRKAANLVFVIDVSGSMGREDRLGLVKKALRLLV
ncbi:MAG: hypothetical protein GY841_14875, partial [FCB group bacterium]|nr:hypothetical protein [FCB group bacterium]